MSEQIKHCLQVKTVQTVLNKYIDGFWWKDNRGWTFSVEEVLLWIMDLFWPGVMI